MQKKLISLLMLLLLLCSTAFAEQNLVQNGDMEEHSKLGLPSFVTPKVFDRYAEANYGISSAFSYSGRYSVMLHSEKPDHLAYEIRVPVEPNKAYLLQGYLRADHIQGEREGQNYGGASIHLEEQATEIQYYSHTESAWMGYALRGRTGPYQNELVILLEMGSEANRMSGTAYFDSISLTEIPGASAYPYFTRGQEELAAQLTGFTQKDGANHLWILLLSALYLAACVWVMYYWKKNFSMEHSTLWFWVISLIILALKIYLSSAVFGYIADVNTFLRWSADVFRHGGRVYLENSGIDYPPAYLYILYMARVIIEAFDLRRPMDIVFIKLFPVLVDALLGIAIYYWVKVRQGGGKAFLLSMLYLLNPAVISVSAAWGQLDAVPTAILLATLMLLWNSKEQFAIPLYFLAVLIKPQPLLVAPLMLLYLLVRFLHLRKSKTMLRAFCLRTLLGMGIGLLLSALIILPFSGAMGGVGWLFERFAKTLASYQYSTFNAYNLYYLLGLNRASQYTMLSPYFAYACAGIFALLGLLTIVRQSRKLGILRSLLSVGEKNAMQRLVAKQHVLGYISILYAVGTAVLACCKPIYLHFSTLSIVFIFVFLFVNFLYDGSIRRISLWVALCILMIYVSAVRMHERYLYMAVTFFLLDFIKNKKHGSFILYCVTTLTLFHNVALLLTQDLLLFPFSISISPYFLINSVYAGCNILALGYGMYYAATTIYDKYEKNTKETPVFPVPVFGSTLPHK